MFSIKERSWSSLRFPLICALICFIGQLWGFYVFLDHLNQRSPSDNVTQPPSNSPAMLFRVLSFFFVLPTLAFSAPSANNPITAVKLRVEGATETRFEGIVFTRGHNVTTPSGGTHDCDGTNNHINPNPGPTCTSALDTASKLDSFQFDGCVYLVSSECEYTYLSALLGLSTPPLMTSLLPPSPARHKLAPNSGVFF